MIKNIFKSVAEKPNNDVSGNDDTDKNQEAENNMINEEVTETESEQNNEPMSDENNDTSSLDNDVELEEIAETDTEKSNEELVALQNELTELQDKYLRLAAEYDNYRKRTLREKADLIHTAGESLLKGLLSVVDDFERGIEAAANTDDMDGVRVGMGLIYNKLKEFLTNNGVKEIDAMNEPFDTDWHEAVTNYPASSDDMKGMILDVVQKGYMLNNKVIRYPKVVVGE